MERLPLENYCPEEKTFGFHKPKMYQSIEGCCICRANCFELHEIHSGGTCNAHVLLVKRWKKKEGNWNYVVGARAGPSLKATLTPKKVKTLSGNRIKTHQISKLQKEFKASSAQSPCWSNQQKMCCGIIYKGHLGKVLIDTHLFKLGCSNKRKQLLRSGRSRGQSLCPSPLRSGD
ncbi:unnamed protein product [Nyctereutes procyonoides]|uniref:(raccoon dog) hypothetical protein n=1 Tax=Nyctereutes procyonoides TaxID=34880 RepID=A0A811ZIG3_NYCPR|nr:unnamed protein product [Nyctereutes procyonoides]